MPIITLTTDLGYKDYYVSSVKASILSQNPEAQIIDITHEIPKFDISQAAFVLRSIIHDFPPGTIHILGVKPEHETNAPQLAVYAKGQYFIGADNGIFSLIFDTPPEKIVELNVNQDTDLLTFPTKDLFVKVACHIARGGTLEVIGKPIDTITKREVYRAVVDGNTIKGTVIYVDSYGCVITNITQQLFREVGKSRAFTIYFRQKEYRIKKIVKQYNDVEPGNALALFGATGNLEIAINEGNASSLLGLKMNGIVRIEFDDYKNS